jgi:hypothetical protein
MNKTFHRRLEKAAQIVERLPSRPRTEAENRAWAEQQIAEMMKEFKLTRDQALELAREHAPTIAGWLTG